MMGLEISGMGKKKFVLNSINIKHKYKHVMTSSLKGLFSVIY